MLIQLQLASIAQYLVRVWYYEESQDKWYMYDPLDLPGSNLTELVDGAGYWIQVTQQCTINYTSDSKTYNYTLPAAEPDWNYLTWGDGVPPPIDGEVSFFEQMLPVMLFIMVMGAVMPMMKES